jgi:anti-sigma-K factor RskA
MSSSADNDLHSLAAPYALDALSAEEAAEFERHMNGCQSCIVEVQEMRETTAFLATSTAADPPAAMRDRVLAGIGTLPQALGSTSDSAVIELSHRRGGGSALNRWLAGVAAAGVLVAGALGVSTYQANQRADEAQVAADQMSAVLSDPNAVIKRAEIEGGGAGTLVMSPADGRAVFMTADLPDAAPDETYQLWAIDGGGATSVGLMEPDAGEASELVDMPLGSTAFGVTVEPSGGSDKPTTDPVLVLELSA